VSKKISNLKEDIENKQILLSIIFFVLLTITFIVLIFRFDTQTNENSNNYVLLILGYIFSIAILYFINVFISFSRKKLDILADITKDIDKLKK
jgi:prepilin signal peptidase PulO-like enzyme (type II secretory pathway)